MPFSLPDGLAPEAYPLAWLVGRWRGEGVVGYPGIDETAFTQEVAFDHEVQRPLVAHSETELTKPGCARRTCGVRQRHQGRGDVVVPGHLVVAVNVDGLMETSELRTFEDLPRNAFVQRTCASG